MYICKENQKQKSMNMKKNLITLVLSMAALCLSAQQSALEEIRSNRFLCASNYLDYDNYPATEALTPTPNGYEMFYLSHYGRHGSRWLLGDGDYTSVLNPLREANDNGKLTATGKELLDKLEKFYPGTKGRLGDLTRVGERQHHGIGRRMTEHFPELFSTKNLPIDARSTVVIRCILSMTAECEELTAFNPTAIVHNDVSESLQYYLNEPWRGKVRENGGKGWDIVNDYKEKLTHPERLIGVLFNDSDWASEHVKQKSFMRRLFDVATNMQSHDEYEEILDLFTDEECYDLWKIRNIDWYMHYGAAPMTESLMPFSQRNLLKNIISTADTVSTKQATLRFGHEVCVMPLACLLELGTCGAVVENLDTLDHVWRNYNIFPMACNVQLAFYRPLDGNDGDILVKALLNEREMTMPIKTDKYPYYKWEDLRQYYLDKIARYEELNKEEKQ